jgi:hypothetical protein
MKAVEGRSQRRRIARHECHTVSGSAKLENALRATTDKTFFK